MNTKVENPPVGYRSVTPYLTVDDGNAALDFYVRAFGAKVRMRMLTPEGRIAHAEFIIGDSVIMLSDEFPPGALSPKTLGGRTSSLLVYVDDVDAVYQHAIAQGAEVAREIADQLHGDRLGVVIDPFGHAWSLATHIEDVSEDEMHRRMAALPG